MFQPCGIETVTTLLKGYEKLLQDSDLLIGVFHIVCVVICTS